MFGCGGRRILAEIQSLAAIPTIIPYSDNFMFKKHRLYIQISRNRITATNLDTGHEVSRLATTPFSTQRVVLARFDPANETILDAIRELRLKTSFATISIVIQQIEGAEGGLSDIEKRALRDLAEMAGAKKVFIAEVENPLSTADAISIIENDGR